MEDKLTPAADNPVSATDQAPKESSDQAPTAAAEQGVSAAAVDAVDPGCGARTHPAWPYKEQNQKGLLAYAKFISPGDKCQAIGTPSPVMGECSPG